MSNVRVASFHLAQFPARRAISKLLTVPAERWELTDAPGCVVGKVLGTTKADTTRLSVEIRRWAIFAVWENAASLAEFVGDSALMSRWSSAAEDIRHFELEPLAARGSWDGVSPFPELTAPEDVRVSNDDRVAVLTRASVRIRKLLTFHRASGPVDAALQSAPGCQFAMGMGEWPVGQQATFSVWDNAAALRSFAYDGDQHSKVIRRTYQEGWYSEELFCRFRVITDRTVPTGEAKLH